MTIMKRVLMGLGALLLCGIVGIGYVVWDSRSAEKAGDIFITTFLADFSRQWALADVETRLTGDNIAQLGAEPGSRILRDLSKLGRLKSIEQLTLVHHIVTTQAKLSTFDFVGVFENGSVVARFRLTSEGEVMRVKDMAIQPSTPIRSQTTS